MFGFRPFSGVAVGWQRRCILCLVLRELHNQGTTIFRRSNALAVTDMGIELDYLPRGEHSRAAGGSYNEVCIC